MENEVYTGEVSEATSLQVLEFRLINPTEGNFLRHIDWNKDEMLNAVKNKVAAYQNVVYTDDTIRQAKADRAELNNLIKKIEDGRKKVKAMVNEPYSVFETELKEITQVIKDACGPIDQQVKEYEEQQKQRKRQELEQTFNDNVGNMADILQFERIFDIRYLNVTYSLEKAKNEIIQKIDTFRTDLSTIDSVGGNHVLAVKDVYIRTMDLSKAMAENARLTALEEKIEADRKAKEEAERRRLEQEEAQRQARLEAEERLKAEQAKTKENLAPVQTTQFESVNEPIQNTAVDVFANNNAEPVQNIAPEPVKKYKATFYVRGTMEQINGLREYMNANGIEFGKVGGSK